MRSERDTTLAGEPYAPFDPDLVRERAPRQGVRHAYRHRADVWIGGGALILPRARIWSRAVIGARSVVTRDVPEGVFAAGNPCRVIRQIDE